MKQIRKKAHEGVFKFRVALEGIRGDKTVAEICQDYRVASSQVYKWKAELMARGASIYAGRRSKRGTCSQDIDKLHATIGRLKVENDFLERALRS